MRCPSPKRQAGSKQEKFLLYQLFYSDTQGVEWCPSPTLLSPLTQMWILYGNSLIYPSRICPLLCLMGMTHKINHRSIQIIIIKWTHLYNLCLLPETTFRNFFLSLSYSFPRVHHPPDTQHFRLILSF